MARGLDALEAGDGPTLLSVLEGAKDRSRILRVIGSRADDNRWDPKCGRAALFVADLVLAEPIADIDRWLPCIAIAAACEHQLKIAARRERGAAVLAVLPPLVAKSEFASDLVTRSGCHAWDNKLRAASKDLFELVRGGKLAAKTPYYRELAKHHSKKR